MGRVTRLSLKSLSKTLIIKKNNLESVFVVFSSFNLLQGILTLQWY